MHGSPTFINVFLCSLVIIITNLVVLCGDLDPVSKKVASCQAISHLRVYDQGEQRDEQEEEAGGQDVHHVQHQGGSEEQDLKQGLL